jgi:hypothetical protein
MALDILATIGITKKVVPRAPKHPKRAGHIPAAPASPLKRWYTMIKNEKDAIVINALYTKKVAIHSFLNGFILKALTKPEPISFKLLPMFLKLRGE